MVKQKRSRNVQKVMVVKPKRKKRKSTITKNVLSKKSVVKMRYADTVSLNPGAAGITSHYFRCNSIQDPDYTGTGHQPFTHDTFASLYNDYRVLSSKVKVTPIYSTTTAGIPALWGVFQDTDATLSYTEGTMIVEDPRTGGFGLHSGVQSVTYGNQMRAKKLSFNAKSLGPEGRDNVIHFGNSPTDNSLYARYFCIWASSILGNDPGSIDFMVEIEYTVELSAPLQITQS